MKKNFSHSLSLISLSFFSQSSQASFNQDQKISKPFTLYKEVKNDKKDSLGIEKYKVVHPFSVRGILELNACATIKYILDNDMLDHGYKYNEIEVLLKEDGKKMFPELVRAFAYCFDSYSGKNLEKAERMKQCLMNWGKSWGISDINDHERKIEKIIEAFKRKMNPIFSNQSISSYHSSRVPSTEIDENNSYEDSFLQEEEDVYQKIEELNKELMASCVEVERIDKLLEKKKELCEEDDGQEISLLLTAKEERNKIKLLECQVAKLSEKWLNPSSSSHTGSTLDPSGQKTSHTVVSSEKRKPLDGDDSFSRKKTFHTVAPSEKWLRKL